MAIDEPNSDGTQAEHCECPAPSASLGAERRSSGKRKAYLSPAIAARRQRILTATMEMIAEQGIDGFNLGELSQRAHVAQKTLYNSFGSKEALIASALDFFLEEQGVRFPADSIHDIEGIVDQLQERCKDFIINRQWVRASNFLYFSMSDDNHLHRTLKDMSLLYIRHFYRIYCDHPDFNLAMPLPYIDMQLANVAHGAVHDWLMGRICDQAFPDAVCFGVISAMLVIVKGSLRAEVDALAAQYAARLIHHPLPDQSLQDHHVSDASASAV